MVLCNVQYFPKTLNVQIIIIITDWIDISCCFGFGAKTIVSSIKAHWLLHILDCSSEILNHLTLTNAPEKLTARTGHFGVLAGMLISMCTGTLFAKDKVLIQLKIRFVFCQAQLMSHTQESNKHLRLFQY